MGYFHTGRDLEKDFVLITAFKICERTCKLHAYQSVLAWALSEQMDKKSVIWYLEQKISGHREFLDQEGLEYDYPSQNIKVRPSRKKP